MTARGEHPRHDQWLGPGELARRANTSIKALRVYEDAGLLKPDRREGGWRIYGPAHVARLHQILALKALGLSLKQIGEALGRDDLAIGRILDLQALHLAQDIRSARRRLRQVRAARDHLAQHGSVPPELMLTLARDLGAERLPDLAELRGLIEGLVSENAVENEVRAVLKIDEGGGADAALEAQVNALLNEAAILAVDVEPGSPGAAALADRWLALAATLNLPSGDEEGAAAMRRLSEQLGADPRLADTFAFVRAAVRLRTQSSTKR